MRSFFEEIESVVNGKTGLVYLQTNEEQRIVDNLREYAGKTQTGFSTWSCIDGLQGTDAQETRDPVNAVRAVGDSGNPGFYAFCDLTDFFDRPELVRALREFFASEKAGSDQFLFIVSSELVLPESIRKDVNYILVPPPGQGEIEEEYRRIKNEYPDYSPDQEFETEIISAMKGLTLLEMRTILNRVFRSGHLEREQFFDQLFEEKQMIIRKSGYLEFTPPKVQLENMGGLSNLKDWLRKRERIFSSQALEAGIPIPKGLLIMGVSGCGKSMAVKTIPALWNVPMYRLDMNLIFSGLFGSAEATFHKALRSLETVAPAVLWIDEIENALGMDVDGGLSISSHIFSSFLTWMQEKPPLIFIAATANKIKALPAEIIRKGRFDEIFFVDIPTEDERRDIFRIYLEKYGADLEKFDLNMLAIMTKRWNGAEIDQVVASARTNAFYEDRPFTEADITASVNKTVPLATTMETQIKNIRSWALSRATPASGQGKILRY